MKSSPHRPVFQIRHVSVSVCQDNRAVRSASQGIEKLSRISFSDVLAAKGAVSKEGLVPRMGPEHPQPGGSLSVVSAGAPELHNGVPARSIASV